MTLPIRSQVPSWRGAAPLALLVVVGLHGAAHADRFSRAETNFKTNCSGCHTIGWQSPAAAAKGKVDLTGMVERGDEQTLRRFLADPERERGATGCRHEPLVRLQVDDLIDFLRRHAQPPPAEAQVVVPRSRFRKFSDPPARPTPGKPVPATVQAPQSSVSRGGAR